jgi:hypothetical protein
VLVLLLVHLVFGLAERLERAIWDDPNEREYLAGDPLLAVLLALVLTVVHLSDIISVSHSRLDWFSCS